MGADVVGMAVFGREFRCGHERTAVRVKVASNGVRHYCRQCLECGRMTEVLRKDAALALVADPDEFDRELERAYSERIQSAYRESNEAYAETLRAERAATYRAYLLSDEWAYRRRKVMERDRYLCQGCRDARATQVHHLHYDRVYREMLFDLVAVCDDCHAAIHGRLEGD